MNDAWMAGQERKKKRRRRGSISVSVVEMGHGHRWWVLIGASIKPARVFDSSRRLQHCNITSPLLQHCLQSMWTGQCSSSQIGPL
jgi:hypothetical protein